VPEGRGGGTAAELDGRRINRTSLGAIQAEAERLGLVSRRGMVAGAQLLLPDGVVFDRSVGRIASRQAARLGCEEVSFPSVYDGAHEGLRTLTSRFDRMGRTYHLAENRKIKLSYAADPNFFLWLEGQQVDLRDGPRFFYSPMTVHKAFRSGEVSVLNQREYRLPDVHALCRPEHRGEALAAVFTAAADGVQGLVGHDWLASVDLTHDLRRRWPSVGSDLTSWTSSYVRIATRQERIGYMSMRVALGTTCGAGTVMLCNIQWDESNGARFGILEQDRRPVSILHATLMGGVAKAMPVVLGRGLSGLRPRRFPFALAPTQLYLLPVGERHRGLAAHTARRLGAAGIRTRVLQPCDGTLGKRIRAVRDGWGQYVTVLGDAETTGEARVRSLPGRRAEVALSAFVRAAARLGARGHPEDGS
jgi:threonyl-tRNA synthetase